MLSDFLTTRQAAEELGLSRGGLYDAIHRGALATVRLGPRQLLIHRDEIERYRVEQLGKAGWEKRREPGFVPNPAHQQAQRAHYERRKQARQQQTEKQEQE